MDYQKHLFVGVDTHKNQHTAVVLNCFHQTIGSIVTPNNPKYFTDFIKNLRSLSPNNETPVFGLEDTQGLGRSLAQWLVEREYTVKEINPTFTKRERKHSPNPDKSDKVDAKAIANVLLTEWGNLPTIVEDAQYKAIRQLNNHRLNLVKQCSSIKNRLHSLLHQQYPNYKQFFSDPFGKTALVFWETFPHPSELKYQGEKRLNSFLKKQAKSISNNKAATILSLVDKDSKGDVSVEARNSLIPMLINQLRLLQKQLKAIEEQLKLAIDNTPYQLTTMPGIGYNLAAMFISEIRNINRFNSSDQLARFAGLAPTEYSSGTSKNTSSQKYGCRDLNHAFYLLAIQQVGTSCNGEIKNPVAYKYYQKKLAEGKSRQTALTCLQRRLVDIIFAMLRDGSAYKLPEIPEYQILDKAS